MSTSSHDNRPRYQDGRDEMNLADFPLAPLQRTQLADGTGQKLDRLEFEATRYDPVSKRRVAQRVTLTTSARDGLPTPADEHVILALLYVAKHSDNFGDATVHFAPSQLFEIMGWAPNGRSYDRLRDVLRRLKSLTIRYENAWWDAAGRGYEEEVATGIISGYRIARQTSGPRTPEKTPASWVTWTQQFHDSLKNGNIKRLNLEVFFKLSSPTAQRMYRFLDKRFYNQRSLSMDLVEFACGHIGLTEVDNVAILKRRLAPAIAELEEMGFLEKLPTEERFQKVKVGVWKVLFKAGGGVSTPEGPAPVEEAEPEEPRRVIVRHKPSRPRETAAPAATGPAVELAKLFYALWSPEVPAQPGVKDLEQAAILVAEHGEDEAKLLLPLLVEVTRKEWPECRTFSGACQKYLGDALKARKGQLARKQVQRQTAEVITQARVEQQSQAAEERARLERWNGLSAEEQATIREIVLARLEGRPAPEAFVRRMCLEELGRRPEPAEPVRG
jgi:hypothetical protein